MAKRASRKNGGGRAEADPIPPGLGPYEVWNFGAGRDYVFTNSHTTSRHITALAELKRSDAAELRRADDNGTQVWLPTLWKKNPFTPSFLPFVVGKPAEATGGLGGLRRRLHDALAHPKVRRYLKSVDIKQSRFRAGLPVSEGAMKSELVLEPSAPNWQPDTGLRRRIGADKRITIFAVIDDGLPFAHRNFRDASGTRTRVEFCWLQSARADKRQKSVLFGREYTRADIDDDIARYGADEDALYRAAGATVDTEGLASTLERHTTHGAHVMDLATGYDPARGEEPAEEIRIIGVQLPNVLTMDTSGVGKDMYLLSAFHYIFHRADLIAEKYRIERPRLVINFSYGYSAGPHTGRVDIEEALGELVRMRRETTGPTALVLPAGNSFLDRMHASIPDEKFAEGNRQASIHWRLQPNDRTPNYLELWFPSGFDARGYSIEVQDPSGVVRGTLAIGVNGARGADRATALRNDAEKQIGQLSADLHRQDGWRVLVVTAPSEPEDSGLPAVEAGAWTIVVKRTSTAATLAEPIRCWIQRDTDPSSFRCGARQSYFDDLDDVRYRDDGTPTEMDTPAALLRRFGALNGLATVPESLAVAGFRLAGLIGPLEGVQPASYSGAGIQPAAAPRARVTCAALSERSHVLTGTIAAGVRSGALSRLQGTSAAAPFVARQLATAFVSASDAQVRRAERDNYRPLLQGKPVHNGGPAGSPNSVLTDRLGAMLIPPHRQPGVEIV